MSRVCNLLFILTLGKLVWQSMSIPVNKDEPYSARVVGGAMANKYQFPYLVSIQYRDRHNCGGGIVSVTWIISAAHCFSHGMREYEVVAGRYMLGDYSEDIQKSHIKNLIIHPRYRTPERFRQMYDISLVELQIRFTFTDAVKPLVLPYPNQFFFGTAVLAGWGLIKRIPITDTVVLQYINVNIIDTEACKRLYKIGERFKLQDTVCAIPKTRGPEGGGTCNGDSGGPLVQKGVLVGIVSWGSGSCSAVPGKGLPNVYTRVSSYVGFIKQYVKNIDRFRSRLMSTPC